MSAPVPAPRFSQNIEIKKPIPAPRKLVPIIQEKDETELNNESIKDISKENETNVNTFSRHVKAFSSTSKLFTEELAGKVQEKKKAVIEGTRQSMRKITRRFTTVGYESTATHVDLENDRKSDSQTDLTTIFNSISFQSPLNTNRNTISIYNNIDSEQDNVNTDCVDFVSLPPPLHPPPPLREDSIYDQPSSLISGSSNSNTSSETNSMFQTPANYESVFPTYPYNSDSGSCIDLTAGTIDRNVTASRSESWNFYDPVSNKTENIYGNIDSTPTLSAASINVSEISDDNLSNLGSNVSHIEIRNTLYENHTIIKPPPRTKKNRKTAESVILQFDPLTSTIPESVNDLRALEELLQGNLYGKVSNADTYDNWSSSSESEVGEYTNPPTPPVRFDSLPEDAPLTPSITEKSKSNWFVPDGNTKTTLPTTESKGINWFKQVNEVLKKAPEFVKTVKPKGNTVARPTLSSKGAVVNKGMLYKVTSGPYEDLFGEFSARWCILENGSFICYNDNNGDNIKENFLMHSILSIQSLMDHKYKFKYENDDLHCLEINISGKSRGGHVYGSKSISERRIWMQRLAESLTNRFSAKIISEYSRIGWSYVKEGVSGQWIGAWLVLCKRTLYYAVDDSSVKSIDLRKARCIVFQNYQDGESIPLTNDKGPNMLVDIPNGVLYLRMWTTRETRAWCQIVRLAAHNNGAYLEQQQLTKNDIPVIVEKCINFIFANGSMSEGIYRRAGGATVVQDILTKFRRDAWAVQLTIDQFSEHDVATSLKRFFRDLPEPLLTTNNRQYLYQVTLVKNTEERIRMYKAVFDQFSPITYNTAKKLIGHLHFIHTQSKRNRMTVDNLSAVWGPTLMHCDDKDDNVYQQKEAAVINQLILMYRSIFSEHPEEIEQEKLMLKVLQQCVESPHGPVNTKSSGDFRVWVYLYNKEGQTFNVAVGPQKTAYEVCVELSPKIKLGVHELQLEELVLNDNLTRPVHHTEKVLDVVLRWGYWDEPDRKDNCLVLSPISKYWEYILDKPLPVSGELKFADNKSKAFKNYTFEFAQAKLSYYKDKTCSSKLNSWNVEDIFWYFGHEPRRNPQTRWTITFISRKQHPNRSKSSPWFGNIIAWTDPGQRASWLAAMLKAEHPNNLTPSPQHINLMMN